MTTAIDQPEDVLVAYYESFTRAETKGISRFFDKTFTVITLAGSTFVNGAEAIDNLYRNLCETWVANGLSTRIGYDRSRFETTEVQENAKIVRTRLTNYTQSGERHQSWNCTYALCKSEDGWKILLATSDNQISASASLN